MQPRTIYQYLLACVAVAVSLPAFALERAFPENAKRGMMTPAPYPQILIDGRMRQMTPGARIWNQQNLTEVPASVRGADLTVNYTETEQGEIDRVWILRPEEARQPSAR